MKRPKRICPKHQKKLVACSTKWGTRYNCPTDGCTVVLWNGSTSTPADYQTRQARIQAHNSFDELWRSGVFTRREAYKKLEVFLGLSRKETHIGHFNIKQCQRTLDFCNAHTKLYDGDIL